MGKYIHLFQTKEEFNQAIDNNFIEPWISYTKENDKVDYYKTEYEHKCEQYFTIEATQDGTTVYFRRSSYAVNENSYPLKVEISVDGGMTWTEVTAAPAEDDVPGAVLVQLDERNKALIRGKNEAYGYYSEDEGVVLENCNFWADKPCYVYGNIMSLVDGDNFARLRKVKEYAFAYLFSDYDGELDWSWVLSKEGEELLLPATTLAVSCYHRMFRGCTGLTSAPKLPATNLASWCYDGMFGGCTGLTSVLKLPATTLVDGCYNEMFIGCTSLTSAPDLPATTLADYCYTYMFKDCTNLSYIKAMFTTAPGNTYTINWVDRVSATGTFVKNSAATWNVTGDNGIPTGWTVQTANN